MGSQQACTDSSKKARGAWDSKRNEGSVTQASVSHTGVLKARRGGVVGREWLSFVSETGHLIQGRAQRSMDPMWWRTQAAFVILPMKKKLTKKRDAKTTTKRAMQRSPVLLSALQDRRGLLKKLKWMRRGWNKSLVKSLGFRVMTRRQLREAER